MKAECDHLLRRRFNDSVPRHQSPLTRSPNLAYSYDSYRQLIQATTTAEGTETDRHAYLYDGIGTTHTPANFTPQVTTYTPNSVNQYASITGALADTPTYDDNGNTLTTDGFTLTYDEENRLIEASTLTQRSLYLYDGNGRRVERQDYTNGTLTKTSRFVYDGWRVMEELDETYATTRSYTRGLDLSGSPEGAGGIGGLLALSIPTAGTYQTANYTYDGNGNVSDLTFTDGTNAAHYTYTPFGARQTATGAWAELNPYQFSSKEREPLTGFYYYGFRYYNPSTGRWPSRDPIAERGGANLYGMVGNNSVNYWDFLGLEINNEIFNKYKWKYNRNSIKVTFCGCDQVAASRAITEAFAKFSKFNYSGLTLDTTGLAKDGTGIVKFKPDSILNEWLGHFGGLGDTHDVTVYGPKAGTNIDQRAITNPWHGLVGVRFWWHNTFDAKKDMYYGVEGWTLAHETWNNAGGYAGGEGQINKAAKSLWPAYLKQTILGVLADLNCKDIVVLVETENYADAPLFDEARPNPLLKNIPEAKLP